MIAVTGATGALGGRVASLLAERDVPIRRVVRDPSRAPSLPDVEVRGDASYADGEAMRRGFEGADTVFLVSAGEDEHRIDLHRNAVDAAAATGVRRIVYTSWVYARPDTAFTFGRDHFGTEEHVKQAGLEWTFLRDSIYTDYVAYFAGADGVIRGPAGDGRVATVVRDDIAECAAVVLAEDGHAGKAYEITGPERLDADARAAVFAELGGRAVEVVQVDDAGYAAGMAEATGMPLPVAELYATFGTATRIGALDALSDDFETLTGQAPRSLRDVLTAATPAGAPPACT